MTRTFKLVRNEDDTGISGTGVVACGALFPNGRVALSWCVPTMPESMIWHACMEDMEEIYLHGGKTVVEWDSDPSMSLNEYQNLSMRTCRKYSGVSESSLVSALGISGEAGELANKVKKMLYHNHQFDPMALIDELGDVLFYIATMARGLGCDLSTLAEINIKKLQVRYPEGFSTERSINRDDNTSYKKL